jgi:transglutaminase-like putative cysteine protease
MAHPDGTSARAHRLIGLAASLLLAVTTALAFGRVFVGAAAGFKLIAVAIASAGLAVVFERRSLLLATIASAAGVAVAVGLMVFPDTTWYGLPTADTLRAALDAAGAVGEQARIQVAPAVPIAPLLLAAVVSLWAAIFSSHALAFRAGSPLLGLVPPVALVAFADTVLEQFVKPLYGWAFLVAALLVVFADGLARVQGWGPVWSSSRRGVAASAGRGARRLAGTVLTAALVAPLFVPGFGSRAVIDFGTPSDELVTIDPFVTVTSQLSRRTPVTVLEFTSPQPTYLRLVSLPNFDGQGWRPDPPEQIGQPLGEGGAVPNFTSLLPGGIEASAQPVSVRVLTDLGIPWIPTPYPVQSIQAGGSSVTYDTETGTAFAEPALREGDTYTLSATFDAPSADELRSVPDSPGFGAPGGDDRYLALPPDLPAGIEEIARAWTAGASTVFDRAIAIQDHLREFDYDPDTQIGGGTEAIVTFLRDTRRGFCQQFAASMAVMLRTLDIPTRVVVGFGGGRSVRGGYEVSSDRAHAWVEVNFRGFGWMPFEPTPIRENPIVTAYTAPETCSGPGCGDGPDGPGAGANAENRQGPRQQGLTDPRPALTGHGGREGGAGTVGLAADPSPISARLALLIAAVVAGVGFLLMPVARAVRRRMARGRAAGEPRRSILVTYEQFTERAAGMGLGRARGETFEEYRRKVLETGYLSDGHLDRLTRIATAAAYSPRDPAEGDARSASEAAGTALTEIRRAVGRARWLVGLYRR